MNAIHATSTRCRTSAWLLATLLASYALAGEPAFELADGIATGGGGTSQADGLVLLGSIGQPVVSESTADGFLLISGICPLILDPAAPNDPVFSDGFEAEVSP